MEQQFNPGMKVEPTCDVVDPTLTKAKLIPYKRIVIIKSSRGLINKSRQPVLTVKDVFNKKGGTCTLTFRETASFHYEGAFFRPLPSETEKIVPENHPPLASAENSC